MEYIVAIYNRALIKPKRVFDVVINEQGKKLKYITQNIRGIAEVSDDDVETQIQEYLEKLNKAS